MALGVPMALGTVQIKFESKKFFAVQLTCILLACFFLVPHHYKHPLQLLRTVYFKGKDTTFE